MNLTVIIPTYNRVQFLSEAVNSLLYQSPIPHEIVIVDDASSDDTQILCQSWKQKKFPTRIIVTCNRKNYGAQVCRNRGLELSTGDAVLFMDSDDILVKNGIKPLLNELETNQNLDYVYGQVLKTDSRLQPLENSQPIGSSFSPKPFEIAGYHWHTMGAIYRKEYLQQIGPWNEQLTGSQDWEFQARIKLAGGQGKFVEHVVGLWRDHSDTRVGTKSFRYDYVESVISACLFIQDNSKEANIVDASLERRLAKKILVHALEFAVNGYRRERNQSLLHALNLLNHSPIMQFAVSFWRILPSYFDFILWSILQRKLF